MSAYQFFSKLVLKLYTTMNYMHIVKYFIRILLIIELYNGQVCPQSSHVKRVPTFRAMNGYIIGGSLAPPYAYPFMARLVVTYDDVNVSTCGGILIASEWVMTAAHCVFNTDTNTFGRHIEVYLGDHYLYFRDPLEQIIPAESSAIHMNFLLNDDSDIALVKLKRKALMTTAVQRGCLPVHNKEYYGINAATIGWGVTSFNGTATSITLKVAVVPILSGYRCYIFNKFNRDTMICTGFHKTFGQDTIFMGDSGGPLFVKNLSGDKIIIGIASSVNFFPYFMPTVLCAVYTKVSAHIPWIEKEIGTDELCLTE